MTTAVLIQPGYRGDFPGGSRFVLRMAPPDSVQRRGTLLCIQPFLDEATLARRALVEQARRLASEGWVTLIPDLFGTGDSAGESTDANAQIWLAELGQWAGIAAREVPGGPLVIWGVRMGAVLAAQLTGTIVHEHHLLLWQAPANGRSLIDPLRKLGRIKSEQIGEPDSSGPSGSSSAAAGKPEEVEPIAGYQLARELLSSLEAMDCAAPPGLTVPAGRRVLLLNTQRVLREGQPAPPALSQLASSWRTGGWKAEVAAVAGEPYWSSMEPNWPLVTFQRTGDWLRDLPRNSATPSHPVDARSSVTSLASGDVGGGVTERALMMPGAQGIMVGILCLPRSIEGQRGPRSAAIIVAGQPQTRVGSHRMFVDLARGLAKRGIASLRFDVGGWGDSAGEARAFEASAPDIAAAARELSAVLPNAGGEPLQIWVGGLCDGASAALLAVAELKVAGIEPAGVYLLNPWVRSDASLGDAMIKNYYAKRILDPDFWKRLFTGRISVANLLIDPWRFAKAKLVGGTGKDAPPVENQAGPNVPGSASDLPTALLACAERHRGQLLTILSGTDLTAAETESLMAKHPRWQHALTRPSTALLRIAGADHTFSNPAHWDEAIDWLANRIKSL